MISATPSSISFTEGLNLLSQFGVGATLILVWRLFGTVKQYYEIREEAIQKRVQIETTNLSSSISVLKDRLSQKDEYIKQLQDLIQAHQFKNNVIINSFIDIGIANLDADQRKELQKIVTEQEELRIASLESIETLTHLVKVNFELGNYQKAIGLCL